VETGGLVTITYESGVVATIDCSWSQPPDAPTWGGLTVEVFGTKGSIAIDPFGARVEGFGSGGPLWLPLGADLDAAMLDEFLGSVRERRPPAPDGRAGLRAVELMAAAQASAATGRPVQLPARG
jgi:predicted dehydrogenase